MSESSVDKRAEKKVSVESGYPECVVLFKPNPLKLGEA